VELLQVGIVALDQHGGVGAAQVAARAARIQAGQRIEHHLVVRAVGGGLHDHAALMPSVACNLCATCQVALGIS
jgi:hypothetical protein